MKNLKNEEIFSKALEKMKSIISGVKSLGSLRTVLNYFSQNDLILSENSNIAEYTKTNTFSNLWLKNLFLEMNFLNLNWDSEKIDTPIIVYIGDLITHLYMLAKLYPHIIIDVYGTDQQEIDKLNKMLLNENETDDHSQINVYSFNSFNPESYKDQKTFLMTSFEKDIPVKNESAETREEFVYQQMMTQLEWRKTIDPVLSFLYFRPPKSYMSQQSTEKGWKSGIFEYLSGIIYFPIFGTPKTTKCRIVIDKDATMRDYDTNKYGKQCNYFNQESRFRKFYNIITSTNRDIRTSLSLHNDFDATAATLIIRDYFLKFGETNIEFEIIQKMLDEIFRTKGLFGV